MHPAVGETSQLVRFAVAGFIGDHELDPTDLRKSLEAHGVRISDQLGLPGVADGEVVVEFTYKATMRYLRVDFELGPLPEPVKVEEDAPEHLMLEQMERRMRGEVSWVQLQLPGVHYDEWAATPPP